MGLLVPRAAMETAAVLFCFLRGRAGTWRGNVMAHAPSPRLPPSPAEVRLPPRLPVLRGPRRWGRRCLRCEGPAVAVQRVRCEEPRRQHTTGPSHVHPSSPPPPRARGKPWAASQSRGQRRGRAMGMPPPGVHPIGMAVAITVATGATDTTAIGAAAATTPPDSANWYAGGR